MYKSKDAKLLPSAFGGGSEAAWLELIKGGKSDKRMHTIYVLDDGETYSGRPTVPVEVTQSELERIEGGEKVYIVVPDWDRMA